MNVFSLSLSLLLLAAASLASNDDIVSNLDSSQAEENSDSESMNNMLFHRKKKLLGTTTTVTSTLSTGTLCFTTAGITGACNRKKKAIVQTPLKAEVNLSQLSPSKATAAAKEGVQLEVSETPLQDLNQLRNPKFLFFIYTSTTTSTITAFTATTTVSYTDCTPDVILVSACG